MYLHAYIYILFVFIRRYVYTYTFLYTCVAFNIYIYVHMCCLQHVVTNCTYFVCRMIYLFSACRVVGSQLEFGWSRFEKS